MTNAPPTNIPVAIPAGQRGPAPVVSAPAPVGQRPATIAGSLTGVPGARTVLDRLFYGTPGRMRLVGLLAVVAALVLGAASVSALLGSQSAVERAANSTAQVVRAQSLHVELLRADAVATNGFLVGGLESPEARAQYEAAMAGVARGIAGASAAQPADADALGALSTQVQRYAALVEQARSNNRVGLPVGAQYLKEASAGLRADAIPVVNAVVAENESRADREFDGAGSTTPLVIGVLALAVLLGVAVWLARRTHRYLNGSLSAGIALLALGLVAAAVTISSVGSATRTVAGAEYKRAVALADVRTFANDARANESLTLIARGSGQANEKAWQAANTQVLETFTTVRSTSALRQQWEAYTRSHQALRKLDDAGKWDDAVKAATATGAGSATALFTTFDTAVTKARDLASNTAVAKLGDVGGRAPWWALAVGLASLAAGWLVVRGIGQRIEEYR